jgi:putative hydrolase of the HAD superfamily
MSKNIQKVVLFDADGVLTLPEEVFAVFYAKSRGLDPKPFREFFKTKWKDIVTGKKDLKESIEENPQLWKWDGTPDELLEYWFKTEDVKNDELIRVIRDLKDVGIPVFMATDQEKYRAKYMREVMFPGMFEEFFVSCEIGINKKEPGFFDEVLKRLNEKYPDIKPSEVVFFDDSAHKVESAKNSGLDARLYTSVDQVKELLN